MIQQFHTNSLKAGFQKDIFYTHVYIRIIDKSQKVEATQVSTDGWMNLKNTTYTYNEILFRASLTAQLVKNPPAMLETLVWFLGWEDPLEKG